MTEPVRPFVASRAGDSSPIGSPDRTQAGSASIGVRLTARLRTGHFDRLLAVGSPVEPGSAISVHAARITSVTEREAIARTLLRAVREPVDPTPGRLKSTRVPVHRANVASAETAIDAITLRLHSPRPVTARGMARLRVLLSDGAGPFYLHGRGDLAGRLGAALAAL
jgi:hypothetical protein